MADESQEIGGNTEQSTDSEARRLANLRPPWKPGESGNPSGRPKKKPITEMFERIFSDPELVTQFESAVVRSITKGGMAGVMYMKDAADRLEGKVTQPLDVDLNFSLAARMAKARERTATDD